MKIGRNDKCPCASGKKYKYCCLGKQSVKISTIQKDPNILNVKNLKLLEFNYSLRKCIEEIIDKEYKISDDKKMFTAFCLGKAYKTQGAILFLCKNGFGQDASILLRSIVDILITLLYIKKDPTNNRMQRYFDYDWVLRKTMFDYCKTKPEIMKQLEDRGTKIDLTRDSIETIEKEAKQAQDKHNYAYGRWSAHTTKQMAEEVGRADLYLTVYRLQSQLAHTAPRTMNEYITQEKDGFVIEVGQNEKWITETLVATFDCIYNIVGEFDKDLQLGFADRLDIIAKAYFESVGELNKEIVK